MSDVAVTNLKFNLSPNRSAWSELPITYRGGATINASENAQTCVDVLCDSNATSASRIAAAERIYGYAVDGSWPMQLEKRNSDDLIQEKSRFIEAVLGLSTMLAVSICPTHRYVSSIATFIFHFYSY